VRMRKPTATHSITGAALLLALASPVHAETQDLVGPSPAEEALDDLDLNPELGGNADLVFGGEGAAESGGDVGGVIDDTAGDVGDVIDDTVGDVERSLDEGIADVESTVEEVANIDSIGDIQDAVGSVRETFGNITEGFGIIDQIQGAIDGVMDTISQLGIPDIGSVFSSAEQSLDGPAGSASEAVGAVGVPDPNVAIANIEEGDSDPTAEVLGTKTGGDGSSVVKSDTATAFEVQMAREVANASALDSDAQERLAANGEIAGAALETSAELAEDSQNQDVTQNIERNQSEQLAALQQTGTLQTYAAIADRRDDAVRMRLDAGALEQLQRENTAERQVTAGVYSGLLVQGGQFALPGYQPEE